MKFVVKSTIIALAISLGACSEKPAPAPQIVFESPQPLAATDGVVHYVWEEPMVDVVDIPPGLDPDGVYYRPAHKQVVEIRQGRWQHNKEPNNAQIEGEPKSAVEK